MGERGTDWSAAENRSTVEAYLLLLLAQFEDRPMVKADINRQVQASTGRGRGAIEFKFQNVSAVLRDMRHPFVDGYKPAGNYQASLRDAVIDVLSDSPVLMDVVFSSMTASAPPNEGPPAQMWNLASPPLVELKPPDPTLRRAMRCDFVRLDAENRSLGHAGELAVVDRERRELASAGRSDLAAKVEHVAETMGDGLGFDVLSYTLDGTEKYIEVKTTRLDRFWPMLLSRNEVDFSRQEPERFHLYRVFSYQPTSAGLYVLRGSAEETCQLDPAMYRALPR